MKVRQIFVAGLLALGGALLTWATAAALEQYAVDKHASSAGGNPGGTFVPPTDRSLRTMF